KDRAREQRDRKRGRKKAAAKAWRALRPLAVFACGLALCAGILYGGYRFVTERLFSPVDISDATPMTITISSGSGASSIAKKLYEAGGVDEDGNILAPGLISSKTVFKIYVDFTGKSDKLKAGTYILSRNMDVSQIVDAICEGNAPRTTLKLVVTEGMTVEQIANKLVSLGVLDTTADFLSLCRTGEEFADYDFIKAAVDGANPAQERDYALEGYLFPDTYEIYSNESAKSVINRMLYRFSEVMSEEFVARAEELGLSVDDLVTLASVIEKEAKVEGDFAKVSAVFRLRLDQDMKLQSDATLKYIFETSGNITFMEEQRANPSKYNTYLYGGLPLGPICNPGLRAIKAALYPDEETLSGEYLYFCLSDNESGALVFAKTLEEHEANIEKYKPFW
ncbi:MAG TPA: endolytic transglycosylase MltG, partial [Clostridia bacterium]|nr:endolytic transglycosylase MltG [Clostridia bacterium]